MKEQENTKPNILFIFADDQAYNTINALGDERVITPNLDRLVRNGVSFTNSFNMGGWNGAVCIASRTMLFTGRNIWNAFGADSLMHQQQYELPLWSELMQQGGYETYMSGKWHIETPAEEVFNHVMHVRPGMPNQTEEGYNRPQSAGDTTWRPWDKSKEGFWKGGKHWSEVLGDDAVHFLNEAGGKDTPFFMYLAFNAPHDPRQSPEEFVDMYPLDSIEVPESFLEEYPYNEEMGSGRQLRDERLAPFPRTEYAIKVNRQEYYAIITHMDQQVGRILEALEKSGKRDNTYIVFAADHGLSVGHHGLLGKQNMYDHSIRIPMLLSGPGLPQNKKIESDVYVQDMMPTILEIAGIQQPEFIDFQSVLRLIEGSTKTNYPSVYGGYTMTQRMVRSEGFKLIAYPNAKKIRLFDLQKDPMEMNDLSDNPEYLEKKKALFEKLLVLQEQLLDPLRFSSADFNNVEAK